MDLPIAALMAGGAGWRDAHVAVRTRQISVPVDLRSTRSEAPDDPLLVHIATCARRYARDRAAALGLTPREYVVLWRTYFHAYHQGVLDAAQRPWSRPLT